MLVQFLFSVGCVTTTFDTLSEAKLAHATYKTCVVAGVAPDERGLLLSRHFLSALIKNVNISVAAGAMRAATSSLNTRHREAHTQHSGNLWPPGREQK